MFRVLKDTKPITMNGYLHLKYEVVMLGFLIICGQQTNAEYTWNGSDWVWNEQASNEISGSGEEETPFNQKSNQLEGSGFSHVSSEEDLTTSIEKEISEEIVNFDDVATDINFEESEKEILRTNNNEENASMTTATSFFAQPGTLAAIVGGAVVGLLCAILCVMFIVYRMRKKDEGSYALDEPKHSTNISIYSKAPNREFYA